MGRKNRNTCFSYGDERSIGCIHSWDYGRIASHFCYGARSETATVSCQDASQVQSTLERDSCGLCNDNFGCLSRHVIHKARHHSGLVESSLRLVYWYCIYLSERCKH